MKLRLKIALVAAAFSLLAVPALAQQQMHDGHSHASKPMKQAGTMQTVYACAKCHTASAKAGKCACGADTTKMTARVAYACTECHKSSARSGACKCGKEMQKVAIAYTCEACHVSSQKPADCKGCGEAMKKRIAKMM